MYPDHLENWLDFGHRLLIFLILAAFWLCETGQICNFRAFSWEHKGGMVSNFMLMYSDHLHNRLDFGHSLLTFLILASFWLVTQVKFGVSRIFFRTHGRNGLKFYMLMYPDHLLNWLHLGHGLLVFPGTFITMYGRNEPKFVIFISILWYPQNWKRQILTQENYPVTEWGYPWLLCSQTFLVWLKIATKTRVVNLMFHDAPKTIFNVLPVSLQWIPHLILVANSSRTQEIYDFKFQKLSSISSHRPLGLTRSIDCPVSAERLLLTCC